jgi:hypothetical protein
MAAVRQKAALMVASVKKSSVILEQYPLKIVPLATLAINLS